MELKYILSNSKNNLLKYTLVGGSGECIQLLHSKKSEELPRGYNFNKNEILLSILRKLLINEYSNLPLIFEKINDYYFIIDIYI